MDRRLELHALLKTITPNVYFQPPNRLVYPCIVYEREYIKAEHAANNPYRLNRRYMVTVIDQSPDSALVEKVAMLESASHVRFYTADDLNHDVFRIYF